MAGERSNTCEGGMDRLGWPRASANDAASNSTDSTHVSTPDAPPESDRDSGPSGGAATSVKPKPARPRVDRLPPWNVLLHNDDKNEMGYVIEAIIELTYLNPHDALIKMVEAHKTGVALLLTVHREFAELLQEQFASKGLTVTIEPDR